MFFIYKRRRTFSLVSVVASGKKYFIVPVYILKHLHTVTLVQSQTIAIREPRDAGRLTQSKSSRGAVSRVFKFCRLVALASSGAIGLPRITRSDVTRSKKDRTDDPFSVKFFRSPEGRSDYT